MMSKFLMRPKTKFNPRFHATSRELELMSQVTKELRNTGNTYLIGEAPMSVHGQCHFGHFYDKTLKDIVRRYKSLRGYNVQGRIGWECFGPEIEHAAFQELHEKGTSSLEYDEITIRKVCSDYVQRQVISHMKAVRRWGIVDSGTYLTIDPKYQQRVLKQLAIMLREDRLFQSHKTIFWSQSRLGEVGLNSVVISERQTPGNVVKFQISNPNSTLQRLKCDVYILVTVADAWMLSGMQALQVGDVEYMVIQNIDAYVVTKEFYTQHKAEFAEYLVQGFIHGKELDRMRVQSVVDDYELPIILNQQLSIVCPAHRIEDVQLAKQCGLSKIGHVDENGCLTSFENAPVLPGDASRLVIKHLRTNDHLMDFMSTIKSQYYHHKVTGEELILRSVVGWFLRFDEDDIDIYTDKLPQAVKDRDIGGYTHFLELMEDLSGEWCISNQNVWGIPIPLFKYKDGHSKFPRLLHGYLLNADIVEYFSGLVSEHGSDIYWQWNIVDLLPEQYRIYAQDLTRHTQVLDSAFVSGCVEQPVDLIYVGRDQHEQFLFGSQMISMFNQELQFKQLITHRVIEHEGDKMSKDNAGPLIDLIEGAEKLNGDRQYGSGADVLRSVVVSMQSDIFNQELVQVKTEQINFIRKSYWMMLGMMEGKQIPNLQPTQFVDRFIYDQLVLYLVNITKAYEDHDYTMVYFLYFDFIQNYLQPYIDSTRNQLISYYQHNLPSLSMYHRLLDWTITTISPILCFNAQDIHPDTLQWPKVPVSHVKAAQDNIIFLNLYYKLRKHIMTQYDEIQERIKQKKIAKQLEVVFIIELDCYEFTFLDYAGNGLAQFLGCAKVTIETTFQNKKRPNHTTMASLIIQEHFLHQQLKMKIKMYMVPEEQCSRCLDYKVKSTGICHDCNEYEQIDHQDIKYL